MHAIDVSIVIVTSNTRQLLHNCLESVYENTTAIEYEVIVVDNNSADGSAEMVEEAFPVAKLIRNDQNLGFSKGNNQGFAASRGRYILALNSDTIVPGDAVQAMVRFMDEQTDAGACGCKLLNANGSLQPSWESFPTMLSEIFYGTPLSRVFPHRRRNRLSHGVYEVDWVSGACLMVRREAFEQVGGFDERFTPAYSEETDWCYRIKAGGWKIYHLTEIAIVHLWGQTAKAKPTRFFLQLHRSKYLFFRKHKGVLYAEIYRILRATSCLIGLCVNAIGYVAHSSSRDSRRSFLERNWALFKMLLGRSLKCRT